MNPDKDDPVDTLYREGTAALEAGRPTEAAALARRAIALEPGLPALHCLSGSALHDLGEYAAAEAAFETCLALGPAQPLALNAEMRAAQAWARRMIHLGRTPAVLALSGNARRSISVIICSVQPVRFARVSAVYHALLAGVEHEIIGIHDAKSLCEGYNRGIRQSRGDILVFSHDDIDIVAPDFTARLLERLAHYDLIGVAGTTRLVGGFAWMAAGWPHIHGQIGVPGTQPGHIIVTGFHMRGDVTEHAQAMDGVLIAARREVAERIGFDEQTFDGWHLYDFDFTFAAHLAGYRAAICHDLHVVHDSSGNFGEDWQRYARRFKEKYRSQLPQDESVQPLTLCSVEVESALEWRLMTERMTVRAD